MEESLASTSLYTAQHACTFCRKRKRGCDRKLPECSMCSSKGLSCDYSLGGHSSGSTEHKLSLELGGAASILHFQSSLAQPKFPAAYFMDHQAFLISGQRIPVLRFKISSSVTDTIGYPQTVAVEYFQRIHWWMPIISRKSLLGSLHNVPAETANELPLLILAMKVLLWNPSKSPNTEPLSEAYLMAKSVIAEAVAAGILSLRILQAQVLLAIFELGHAIYPAAYLSVGACARYGTALGVETSLSPDFQLHNPSAGIIEIEEKRRTWWVILILDRCLVTPEFMQLGNTRRPLSTEDPGAKSLLPSDEEAFDRGVVSAESFSVTAAADIKMGSLARMCQASYLLGRVLRYNQSHSLAALEDYQQDEEYYQLDRTVRSLLNLSYVEGQIRRMNVCGQTSICYSALIVLHYPYYSRTNAEHLQFSIDLLKPVVDSMSWDSTIFLNGASVSVEDASPLLLLWGYQAGIIYNRLLAHYDSSTLDHLHRMREKLRIMSQRWLAGKVYLELLHSDLSRRQLGS